MYERLKQAQDMGAADTGCHRVEGARCSAPQSRWLCLPITCTSTGALGAFFSLSSLYHVAWQQNIMYIPLKKLSLHNRAPACSIQRPPVVVTLCTDSAAHLISLSSFCGNLYMHFPLIHWSWSSRPQFFRVPATGQQRAMRCHYKH